jgi:hypothetical protein
MIGKDLEGGNFGLIDVRLSCDEGLRKTPQSSRYSCRDSKWIPPNTSTGLGLQQHNILLVSFDVLADTGATLNPKHLIVTEVSKLELNSLF